MANKIVEILHDQDCECPMTSCDGMWTLKSFGRNSIHHVDPEDVFPNGRPSIGLRRKLAVGLAFMLDYYEHGRGAYSLHGKGTQCQWDTSSMAGILVWENKPSDMGAKFIEDRKKDAEGVLEEYNSWMNGDCYGYVIMDAETGKEDSCWGFIGTEHLMDVLGEQLEAGDKIMVKDELGVAGCWPEGVEVVEEFDVQTAFGLEV